MNDEQGKSLISTAASLLGKMARGRTSDRKSASSARNLEKARSVLADQRKRKKERLKRELDEKFKSEKAREEWINPPPLPEETNDRTE